VQTVRRVFDLIAAAVIGRQRDQRGGLAQSSSSKSEFAPAGATTASARASALAKTSSGGWEV
jgi:hypothetical protein